MRRFCAALAAALALATPAAAAPDPEEAAIVGRAEAFFAAMKAKDPAALNAMLLDGVTFTAQRVRPDGAKLGRTPAQDFTKAVTSPGDLDERMWNPVVTRRGPIAVVWAPYEFRLDGKTTHCGIDVFDMVKVDGTWKIAHLMWTQEPDACAELKPRG